MEKDWVLAYSTNALYQATLFQQVLEDHGIVSTIINKQDSSYLVGSIDVYVMRDQILKAKMLAKEFES